MTGRAHLPRPNRAFPGRAVDRADDGVRASLLQRARHAKVDADSRLGDSGAASTRIKGLGASSSDHRIEGPKQARKGPRDGTHEVRKQRSPLRAGFANACRHIIHWLRGAAIPPRDGGGSRSAGRTCSADPRMRWPSALPPRNPRRGEARTAGQLPTLRRRASGPWQLRRAGRTGAPGAIVSGPARPRTTATESACRIYPPAHCLVERCAWTWAPGEAPNCGQPVPVDQRLVSGARCFNQWANSVLCANQPLLLERMMMKVLMLVLTAFVAIFGIPLSAHSQTAPATPRTGLVDNGDGTVTDYRTGLMWEKKVTCGAADITNPRCKENLYYFSPERSSGRAALSTDFLERLNDLKTPNDGNATPCLAGYCDWRLPTVGELRSILSAPYPLCILDPCIASIFGPTQSYYYWSLSAMDSVPGFPGFIWIVSFGNSDVNGNRAEAFYARAVRSARW